MYIPTCEKEKFGESLEPAFLTDQVPLSDHRVDPELIVKHIVRTAGNTVTKLLLVLGHVSWNIVNQTGED